MLGVVFAAALVQQQGPAGDGGHLINLSRKGQLLIQPKGRISRNRKFGHGSPHNLFREFRGGLGQTFGVTGLGVVSDSNLHGTILLISWAVIARFFDSQANLYLLFTLTHDMILYHTILPVAIQEDSHELIIFY